MKLHRLAWLVSFLTGFASLSLEVIWLRIMSFAEGNTPQTMSLVLGLYLLGIVGGAWMGRRITTDRTEDAIRMHAGLTLGASAVVDGLTPVLLILSTTSVWTMPLMMMLILFSASTKAAMFPVVHHLGSVAGRTDTGRSLSRVYFFNILGATLGPLLVGFLAFDWLTSQQLMLGFGAVTLLTAFLLLPPVFQLRAMASVGGVLLVSTLLLAEPHRMMKALVPMGAEDEITFFSENRYGLIHTLHNTTMGDAIFGGNVYDGRLNIDPVRNSNRIDRLLLMAGMHESPRRILVIGLSGGAWVRVLMTFPAVEQIDVVELNPAYMDLVGQTPEVASLLNDPRVHLHFDDGRRWLKKFNGEPFDLIVMNTTFHWRSHVSNLLSADFLSVIRKHLGSQGVVAFNSTDSPDALHTAAHVFPYAYRRERSNFVYAAKWDFAKTQVKDSSIASAIRTLTGEKHSEAALQAAVSDVVNAGWISADTQARLTKRPLEIITDQNMLTEFRYGRQ